MNRREAMAALAAAGGVIGAGLSPRKAHAVIGNCFIKQGRAPCTSGVSVYYEVHGNPNGPALFLLSPCDATIGEHSYLYLPYFTDRYRVLIADYPNGVGYKPDPVLLTAQQVCDDYLAIATHAGFTSFGVAGYSWGGNSALQLATRSNRVTAVAVGGWPALGGPYAELYAESQLLSEIDPLHLAGTDQYVTYYQSLLAWPEHDAVAALQCPRLNYVDADDTASPGIAGRFEANRSALITLGWQTAELHSGLGPLLGHTGGLLAPNCCPLLRSFFDT